MNTIRFTTTDGSHITFGNVPEHVMKLLITTMNAMPVSTGVTIEEHVEQPPSVPEETVNPFPGWARFQTYYQWSMGPHSRACGVLPHPHGVGCHQNCPTCGGVPHASQDMP